MTESRRDGSAIPTHALQLRRVAAYRGIRVLTWAEGHLYACRGYEVIRLRAGTSQWEQLARFRPAWWRNITSRNALSHRLVRDGFHALAVLSDQTIVGAVPGALVTKAPGSDELHTRHAVPLPKRSKA